MSQYAPQHPVSRPAPSSGGGVDIQTLFITAVASAAAAFTCSKIWAPGTLAAAAFTPVIVAIIKEALARSTAVVAKAVPPVRGVVRSARVDDVPDPSAAPPGTLPPVGSLSGDAPAEPATWIAQQQPGEFPVDAPIDVAARVAQPGEITYHDTPSSRRGWKLAVITGLLGFLIGAVIITVPELMAGSSASGGGRETTLFGGSSHKHTVTTTVTTETETQTVPTQTVTIPPAKTVTVPAPTTTVPAPTTTQPPAVAPDAATNPAQTTTAPEVAEPSVPQPPG